MQPALREPTTTGFADCLPVLRTAPLRVAYDARFSIGNYRGMGKYLRRLIRGYEQQFLALCAHGESDSTLPVIADGFRPYPLWEQLSIPRLAQKHSIDILIAPYNTAPLRLAQRTRLILVVHDFMFMQSMSEMPLSESTYQNLGRLYRRVVVPRAIRRAHRIICVSQQTRDELLRQYAVAPRTVEYIPNTVSAEWFDADHLGSENPFVLCVSGEAPNKNLDKGLEGYAEMCRHVGVEAPSLYVVGVKTRYHAAYQALAERLGIRSRVRLFGYLSEEELRHLYSRSQVLFFTSISEGFGIPVLEAMACGVPVVASGVPSVREVAGTAALYFDPDVPADMGRQLTRVLADPNLQGAMSHAGRERAMQFHPDKVDSTVAQFWKGLFAE